ncbi:hypothetical protein B7463_g5506, partial [Scytalidium lignicola]
MNSSKRRKLSAQSDQPQLSAFATRRARQALQNEPKNAVHSSQQTPMNGAISVNSVNTVDESGVNPESSHELVSTANVSNLQETNAVSIKSLDSEEEDQHLIIESRAGSSAATSEKAPIPFSTYIPNKKNLKDLRNGDLLLRIAPGERSASINAMLGSNFWHLSPLGSEDFGTLVRDPWPLDTAPCFTMTTGILFSPFDGLKRVNIRPLISPPEWNEALAKVAVLNGGKAPIVMICGPKSSGKSTFAKLLTNKLWSPPTNTSKGTSEVRNHPGVALLDLDPGQPEYSPPGQLSLIHVQEPNYGPPYSHPIPAGKNQLIKSHTIGALSPSLDPSLYMDCVLDLFTHYRSLLSRIPGCPLIINTPGWVLGTGLEILVDIISKLQPSSVIYMSQEGPEEVVDSLREAAMETPFITLPSQTSGYVGRTAAHLRSMQYMSYFHLNVTNKKLNWSGQPLTSVRPWEIRYSGNTPGILGIMCYGEQPAAEMLSESINGCIVAVVILDSMAAIRGFDMKDPDPDLPSEDEISFIIETPNEHLPYFNPAYMSSLNPRYSQTVGLALIRGIDIKRHRLQILTPISINIIEEAQETGKPIVLVSGKFDTPGWAYTEDLIQKSNLAKASQEQDDFTTRIDMKDEEEDMLNDELEGNEQDSLELDAPFLEAPWIEKLEGSQGRGLGARVWRVRRDLGKTGT